MGEDIKKKPKKKSVKKETKKINIFPLISVILLILLDQFTKLLIVSKFNLYDSKDIIKNVFSLTYIRNEGIAWGMFQGKRLIFIVITLFVLCFCFYVYNKIYNNKKFYPLRICMIFLVAGSIGNMIDRVRLGYVIDFFDFKLINFPVFNVADIFITVSMIFILLLILFFYKEEDFEDVFDSKKNVEK